MEGKKMTRRGKLNRRRFLAGAVGATVGSITIPYFVPSSALGASGSAAANDRIVMASIGVGGQGTHNMKAFAGHPGVQVVAVCDVVTERREKAKGVVDAIQGGTGCETCGDWREIIARHGQQLETVPTPPGSVTSTCAFMESKGKSVTSIGDRTGEAGSPDEGHSTFFGGDCDETSCVFNRCLSRAGRRRDFPTWEC